LLVLEREQPGAGAAPAGDETWVADATKAKVPDRPASGKLHGKEFRVDAARIAPWWESSGNAGDGPDKQDRVEGAVLTLQAGNERTSHDRYTLFLAVKPGETIAEAAFEIPAGGLFKQTKKIMDRDGKGWFFPVAGVQANSRQPDGKDRTDLLPKVTLRLKFGRREKDHLPGTIYLCIDDAEKSFVAGSFEAVVEEDGPALPLPRAAQKDK
jgi:hypothetical protein